MSELPKWLIYGGNALAVVLFIIGLVMQNRVPTARNGNRLSAIAMFIAVLLALTEFKVFEPWLIIAGVLIGSVIGLFGAFKAKMTAMPQMVALFNGAGGGASMLVSLSNLHEKSAEKLGELANANTEATLSTLTDIVMVGKDEISIMGVDVAITTILSVLIGAVTLSGSVVAFMKLQGWISGRPIMLKGRHAINLLSALIIVVLGGLACFYLEPPIPVIIAFWIVGALSLLLGVLMVLPIGGADMPVVISLLNAFSGLAAAMTGFVLENHLLIVVGSLVGASGTVLTRIMSKAMNRSLMNIILGGVGGSVIKVASSTPKAALPKTEAQEKPKTGIPAAVEALKKAERVVVVPGYGMALAQAQFEVVKLTNFLEEQGKNVVFAVHPVAGRMPGHMNVLLAEAEVDYEKLLELEESNEEFPKTDVVMIIGACDVVNPAANDPSMDTPLSGMPILEASKAKSIIVCNLDAKPGYSGVENPLYDDPKTMMLLGDALATITGIRSGLEEPEEGAAADASEAEEGGVPAAVAALQKAERVVVVPGYGMALAQAQFEVVKLTNFLEEQGKNVVFAVHPVAGRMPGHMNVLLAEAEVDYEKLLELEESNEEFPKTDVVMIIGACDVVNPAANDPSMDTPLSGMPILEASKAKSIIVCNLDARPGYSGVENPLYDDPKTLMLLGDALGTIKAIRSGLDKPQGAAAATQAPSEGGIPSAAEALKKAERIVVVPGYGMALAQAQFEVIRLTNFLESQGKNVLFAVHPVAGRMPGHMNVLLAEAEVDYEKLLELEESNAEFPRTDVVMIIGACDVVNPAANDPTMDTPLSGMPILEASQAKAVIVCNLDDRPGYSGVENPLYDDPKTTMLLGDALKTIKDIRKALGSSD